MLLNGNRAKSDLKSLRLKLLKSLKDFCLGWNFIVFIFIFIKGQSWSLTVSDGMTSANVTFPGIFVMRWSMRLFPCLVGFVTTLVRLKTFNRSMYCCRTEDSERVSMFVSPHIITGPSQMLFMCDRMVSNVCNHASFEEISEFGWYTVPSRYEWFLFLPSPLSRDAQCRHLFDWHLSGLCILWWTLWYKLRHHLLFYFPGFYIQVGIREFEHSRSFCYHPLTKFLKSS